MHFCKNSRDEKERAELQKFISSSQVVACFI